MLDTPSDIPKQEGGALPFLHLRVRLHMLHNFASDAMAARRALTDASFSRY